MTNDQSKSNSQNSRHRYDLDERTLKLSQGIVDFCKGIQENSITKPLISQLIRSGTSIGANYAEASEASSKKDFVNKIAISNKEAKETKYWLRVIAHALPEFKDKIRILWKETQELNLIFATIIRSCNRKSN